MAGKARHRQEAAQQQAQHRPDQHRRAADLQGQRGDAPQLRVAGKDQLPRELQAFSEGVQSVRVGVREEQRLAVDLVGGDGGLAVLGHQPAHELLAQLLLDLRMLGRVDQHHAVLVEQLLVALDHDAELPAVLEGEPGAAVAQHIAVDRGGDVQRRAHAAAAFAVAGRLRCGGVDAGLLPQAQLGGVRAAAVTARDEGLAAGRDLGQAGHDVGAARAGRVGLGADQHEVVVHDRVALLAPALGDELVLGRGVVHEDHVGIAAPADVQRLARADGDHAHLDAAGLGEGRQQMLEQSRLLGRGGRGHDDELVLRARRGREHKTGQHEQGGEEAARRVHGRGFSW